MLRNRAMQSPRGRIARADRQQACQGKANEERSVNTDTTPALCVDVSVVVGLMVTATRCIIEKAEFTPHAQLPTQATDYYAFNLPRQEGSQNEQNASQAGTASHKPSEHNHPPQHPQTPP